MNGTNAVLDAVVRAAVEATGAARGWIVEREGAELRVVAAAGERPGDAVGTTLASDDGSAAFVIQSGQPLALTARPGDPLVAEGVAAALGTAPATLLCVPCLANEEVVGALEVVDKAAGAFTVDDVEVVTLLGEVGGAALATSDERAGPLPDPAELGAEVTRLAAADPARYTLVAAVLRELLSRG